MDAVVLANYANEHAPFAIRCMEEGKHVFSEVLPVQTMKEAVELIEAVETGLLKGVSESEFSPLGAITREQTAVILKRLFDYKNGGAL